MATSNHRTCRRCPAKPCQWWRPCTTSRASAPLLGGGRSPPSCSRPGSSRWGPRTAAGRRHQSPQRHRRRSARRHCARPAQEPGALRTQSGPWPRGQGPNLLRSSWCHLQWPRWISACLGVSVASLAVALQQRLLLRLPQQRRWQKLRSWTWPAFLRHCYGTWGVPGRRLYRLQAPSRSGVAMRDLGGS